MTALFLLAALVVIVIAMARLRHSPVIIPLAAAFWAAMPFYNSWVLARCTGDCAIRIDLLIVGPLLLAVTVLALRKVWRMRGLVRRK